MRLIYIGVGDFLPGVPARDLDDGDLEDLRGNGWNESDLLASWLYRRAEDETKRLDPKPTSKTDNA